MGRRRVDEAQAQKACDAVKLGMSVRKAAKMYDIDRWSLGSRLKGTVAMSGKVGPGTVLTEEEENSLEDVLLYAGSHCLAVSRVHLLETVRRLCSDGRPIPWDPEKGPGKEWLAGFLRRHPRVSERTTRIYEANRIAEPDEPRIIEFYKKWTAFLEEHKPEADHVHNTDETGEDMTRLVCLDLYSSAVSVEAAVGERLGKKKLRTCHVKKSGGVLPRAAEIAG